MDTGRLASALLAFGFVINANAHHSFYPHFYPDSSITLTGTITEFEAQNPHAYLHFDVTNENGVAQAHVCESSGVTQLVRNGIEPEIFVPGNRVTVTGQQHRRDPYMCFFRTVQIDDGPVLSVSGAGEPLAETKDAADESTAEPQGGIFGTWLLLSGPPPDDEREEESVSMHDHMTDAGERAVAAYDPFSDDPVLRCSPVGILRVWYAPDTPLQISRDGNRIVLRHEWMDVERIVHLDIDTHPTGGPRMTLGHSIGRLNDGVLTIETANFPAGVVSQYVGEGGSDSIRGLLHSDALTTTETIQFDEQSQTLRVTTELKDPVYFTRDFPPARTRYTKTELRVTPFGCIPEL